MKKQIFSVLLALLAFANVHAQDVIARQHNGQTFFYYGTAPYDQTWVQLVFNQCSAGDTVYLPGTEIICNANLTLNAGIVLIGTGIHPDSVSVYGAKRTRITFNGGQFYLNAPADNAQIHGIVFNGYFRVGNSAAVQNVTNITISRCEFDYGLSLAFNGSNTSSNFKVQNCYLKGGIDIADVQSALVTGCAIQVNPNYGNNSTVYANNLFMAFGWTNVTNGNANVLYRDNIFMENSSGVVTINEASNYHNNLFVFQAGGSVAWGTNVMSHPANLSSSILSDVFVAPPATSPYNFFDYQVNYHLKTSGSNYATYSTMSTTGGQVGLFGGNPNPYWKDGALPFNPHWQELIVPANTTNSLLNLTFKGAAQTY